MDSPVTTSYASFDGAIPGEAGDRSLMDDVRQLADDARALATAEAAYQKARAAFVGQETKTIALAVILAAAFGFFALMALTVGLLLGLTPLITAWGATAVVVGLLVVAALASVSLASRRWSAMRATLAEPEDAA